MPTGAVDQLAALDTTVQVSIITTLGLIIVALIGILTAKITSGARKDAHSNAVAAKDYANTAKDYAEALVAKDALVDALEARLVLIEKQNAEQQERIRELEVRVAETEEQKRAASLIERSQRDEIAALRAEVEGLRDK